MHRAEPIGGEQAPERAQVTVPAAVVEDREQHPPLARRGDQAPALGRGQREGLVDHDGEAGLDRSEAEGQAGGVGGRHHHQVVVAGRPPQLIDVAEDAGAGMLPADLGLPVGVAGDDRDELQPGRAGDEGSVEHGARQPIADQPDPNSCSIHTVTTVPIPRVRSQPSRTAPFTRGGAGWRRWCG